MIVDHEQRSPPDILALRALFGQVVEGPEVTLGVKHLPVQPKGEGLGIGSLRCMIWRQDVPDVGFIGFAGQPEPRHPDPAIGNSSQLD